jgi:hypothetical protein
MGVLRGPGAPTTRPPPCPVVSTQTPTAPPVIAQNRGFDWGDATIGAAGTLALLGVGRGALFLTRRAGRQPVGA